MTIGTSVSSIYSKGTAASLSSFTGIRKQKLKDSYSCYTKDARYVMLCEHIFSNDEIGDDDIGSKYDDDQPSYYLKEEQLFDQFELTLESIEDTKQKLHYLIKKYENAYKNMCLAAYKWVSLESDINENQNLKKMFNDFQLMRKLSGYDDI